MASAGRRDTLKHTDADREGSSAGPEMICCAPAVTVNSKAEQSQPAMVWSAGTENSALQPHKHRR